MKNRLTTLLCIVFSAVILGGCGSETAVLSEMKTEQYVTLGTYTGIEVSVPARTPVTEELKSNYISYILTSRPQWVEVAEGVPAKMGDITYIDYEGRIDGELFEGGSAKNAELQLGSRSFIEGFEEGVAGMCAGDTKEISIAFPDPYQPNPDLSGVPVVFRVTVNGIETQQIPELTDSFVQSLNIEGCTSVAAYDTYVQELLEQEMLSTYDRNVEDALLDKLEAGCKFKKDPPKAMVDVYYDRVIRRMSGIAMMSGMTLEAYVNAQGSDMESFKEEARNGAEASCRESLMLQAVANAEGITVSQEEVDAELSAMAQAGGYESVDVLKEDPEYAHYEDYIMCDKVLTFLREQAVISEY